MQTAEMLVPFVVFGISYANVKFFHKVEKTVKTEYAFIIIVTVFINFLIFSVVFLFSLIFIPSSNIRKHGKLKKLSSYLF
jgi:heme/copper-type cytochrome/quinol oxidase subunit 2